MVNSKEQFADSDQEQLDRLRARVFAAKVAYLNRTPFEDKAKVTYEDLKSLAREYIQAAYAAQKKKFGTVKVKISVAKLLRQR